MELEIIRNYLSTDENLNLNRFALKNRQLQNRNLDTMADAITEKFNKNPEKSDYVKKVIILTAHETEFTRTERFYVSKEI